MDSFNFTTQGSVFHTKHSVPIKCVEISVEFSQVCHEIFHLNLSAAKQENLKNTVLNGKTNKTGKRVKT